MEVYVVIHNPDWWVHNFKAVFSSKELAEKFLKEMRYDYEYSEYSIEKIELDSEEEFS